MGINSNAGEGAACEPPRRSGVYFSSSGAIPQTTWKNSSVTSLPTFYVCRLFGSNQLRRPNSAPLTASAPRRARPSPATVAIQYPSDQLSTGL